MKKTFLDYWGMLLAFVLVSNSTTVMPFRYGSLYYLFFAAALIISLFNGKSTISWKMLLLYGACVISIVFNDIPSFFKPWGRLYTFIMLTALCGPLLSTHGSDKLKSSFFSFLFRLFQIVIIWSTFYLVQGKGYGIRGAYFQGILGHSMIMGPVAGLTVLYCLFQFQLNKKRKWYIKFVYFFLIACAFLCLLQAGSRSALLGTLAAIFVLVFVRAEKSIIKVIKNNFLLITLLICTYPIWNSYLDKLQEKNQESTSLNIDSREVHWIQRLNEWESSPLYGIGFGSVDANAEQGATFDKESGAVETGNSWLCCLSMTGVLGFIMLVVIFIKAFVLIWRLSYQLPLISGFLLGILTFFMFHMMAEGYIFAGGSILNTILWLTLGVMYCVGNNNQIAYELEQKLRQ